MRKFIQNKLKDQKGLTLIELLAVIVILAIIAAIAIPAIGNIIENSRLSAVKSDASNGISAANIYFTDNPDSETVTAARLIKDGYLDSAGKLPTTVAAAALAEDDDKTAVTGVTLFSNVNPLTISTFKGDIDFSGGKLVDFTGATLDGLSDNEEKGSAVKSGGTITFTATGGAIVNP